MAVTREKFSGSTDFKPIQITGTATGSANTIHTAHATAEDSMYVWAVNRHTAVVKLTLEVGGVAVGENVPIDLEPNRPELVLDGQPLTNSLLLKAFAGTTNVISLYGYVNRVTD